MCVCARECVYVVVYIGVCRCGCVCMCVCASTVCGLCSWACVPRQFARVGVFCVLIMRVSCARAWPIPPNHLDLIINAGINPASFTVSLTSIDVHRRKMNTRLFMNGLGGDNWRRRKRSFFCS